MIIDHKYKLERRNSEQEMHFKLYYYKKCKDCNGKGLNKSGLKCNSCNSSGLVKGAK